MTTALETKRSLPMTKGCVVDPFVCTLRRTSLFQFLSAPREPVFLILRAAFRLTFAPSLMQSCPLLRASRPLSILNSIAGLCSKLLVLRLPTALAPTNPGTQGGEKEGERGWGCTAGRVRRGMGEVKAIPSFRNLQTHRQPLACRRLWTKLSGTSAREGRLEVLFRCLCRCA